MDPDINLINFGKRDYDPSLGRWLTIDPAGDIDGMNLYTFLHNNPMSYVDPDGKMAFALFIPVLTIAFESAVVAIEWITIENLVAIGLGTAIACGLYEISDLEDKKNNDTILHQETAEAEKEEDKKEKKSGKKSGYDNEYRGSLPRDKKNNNFLPDPAAEGNEHTTTGIRKSEKGDYMQGATFDPNNEFRRRTDVTNHSRGDHPDPHYHNAKGPNSVERIPRPIPDSFEDFL